MEDAHNCNLKVAGSSSWYQLQEKQRGWSMDKKIQGP